MALDGAAALLLLLAAFHDLGFRTVPNWVSAGIALDGLALRALHGGLPASCATALAMFILAAICWRHGWLGGGDVKLLGAAVLVFPASRALDFVLLTAIMGGVLALLYLALGRIVTAPAAGIRPGGALARVARAERWRIARGGPLPYAAAIASAGLLLLAFPTVTPHP